MKRHRPAPFSLRPGVQDPSPCHLLWIQRVLLWLPPCHFKLLPGDTDVAVASTEGVAGPAGPAPHGGTHKQGEALFTVAALETGDKAVRGAGESWGGGHKSGRSQVLRAPQKGSRLGTWLGQSQPFCDLPLCLRLHTFSDGGFTPLQPKLLAQKAPPKLAQIFLYMTTLPGPVPTLPLFHSSPSVNQTQTGSPKPSHTSLGQDHTIPTHPVHGLLEHERGSRCLNMG